MKKNFIVIFLISVFLLTSNVIKIYSDQEYFSINEKNIHFKLLENEKTSKKIIINNYKYDDITFSAYKESNYEKINSIANEATEEELGSYWLTVKQNFQRSSNNDIESIKPPLLHKWNYMTEKILHSPIVKGSNLYIPCEDSYVYLIDSKTGVYKDRFYFGSPVFSISISGRLLLVQCKDNLTVFDRISKILLWKYNYQNNNIFAVAAINNYIYLSTGARLICFDETTGSIKWSREGSYNAVTLSGEYVIATSINNTISCFNYHNGVSIFQIKLSSEIVGVPSIYDNLIYITSIKSVNNSSYSKINCFDIKGNEVWSYNLFDVVTSSQSISKDFLIIGTVNGDIYAINKKQTDKNSQIAWKYSTKSPIHVSPTITEGNVYTACNNGNIYTLDITNGSIVWKDKVKFPIFSEIVIAQGFMYITDNTGSLYAWGGEWENVVPPMSPEGLNGYSGNNHITLFWRISQGDNSVIGYNLYRKSLYESEFIFIKKLGYVNNYQDYSIKNDLSYNYIIRAFDSFGNESPSSSQVTIKPTKKYEPEWLNFSPTNGTVKAKDNIEFEIIVNTLYILPGYYSGSIFIVHSGNPFNIEPIEIRITLQVENRLNVKPKPPKFLSINISDTRVMLNWEIIDNIKSYKLYRSDSNKENYNFIAEIPSKITIYNDDKVLNDHTYYYCIKSIDNEGNESDFFDEITVIPTPLPIEVKLKDNSIVYDAIFDISGKVDPKAKLFVKSIPTIIDSEGNFTTRIGVPVGVSEVEIKTVDTNGNVQISKVKVNYITSFLNIELIIDVKSIYVNYKLWPYLFDVPPKLVNGRSYVPLSFLSETFGASMEWDPYYKKITYKKNDTIIELWINKNYAIINGKTVKLDAVSFIENNKPMVPIRFIAESLGAKIGWDQNTKIITLTFNL